MKLASDIPVPKHVQFKLDRPKVSRAEALTEIFEKPASGAIHVGVILTVWGGATNVPVMLNFVFGLLAMAVILLCILRSLAIVKKLQMEGTVALVLSILQAVMVGLTVGFAQEQAIIAVLSINLLMAGMQHPYNGLFSRLAAALAVGIWHPLKIHLRVATGLAVADVAFLAWSKFLEYRRSKKQDSKIRFIERTEREC